MSMPAETPAAVENARVAILDRHGRVEQPRQTVGDLEQIELGVGRSHRRPSVLPVGRLRPQQRREVQPRRPADEAQNGDGFLRGQRVNVGVDLGRGADDQSAGAPVGIGTSSIAERTVTCSKT
ncbi:hypothetical protein [Streptomyces malaysiensis]|uniref:hypothetical protein n=1 Tax=Streptomyces malaysiensis TaxID=92644 RepID=UPI002B2B9AAC|nr:hypothetical protein R8789_01990 [Streptomyces malaysiensis]